MASSYTEHYNLSQWKKTDKVLMEDFNADNAKIDAALAEKASVEEMRGVQSALSGKADASALNALQSTVAGHDSALAKKGSCTVGVFTYAGTGSKPTVINFPRKPTAFIVTGLGGILIGHGARDTVYSQNGWMGTGSWSGSRFTGTYMQGDINQQMNTSGQTYVVTAFYTES